MGANTSKDAVWVCGSEGDSSLARLNVDPRYDEPGDAFAECCADYVRPIGIELMHLHVHVRVNKHETKPPSPRHIRRDVSLSACGTTEYRGSALPLSNMKHWQNMRHHSA
jgi:hypothetical protein